MRMINFNLQTSSTRAQQPAHLITLTLEQHEVEFDLKDPEKVVDGKLGLLRMYSYAIQIVPSMECPTARFQVTAFDCQAMDALG